MRLILALRIPDPVDTDQLAMQLSDCLAKLPLPFSNVIAFTPDEGMEETIAKLNSVLVRKYDQAGSEHRS